MDCDICTEKLNKSTRKPVECPFCNAKCCSKCVKDNIEATDATSVCCMFCKKEWINEEFLAKNLTKTYVSKTLKEIKKKVLFDREVALLPDTQIAIEEDKRKEDIKVEINGVYKLRKELKSVLKSLKENLKNQNKILNEMKKKKKTDKEELKKQTLLVLNLVNDRDKSEETYNFLEKTEGELYRKYRDSEKATETERKQFVKACPVENCRGFLSTKWKCGLCNANVCKDCEVILPEGVEHTCNKDDIESIKALKKESKPCPKCAAVISKIDGCDQMWCTQCKTAFSWKTGRIETGKVHNPHFYEWQRQTNGGVAPRVEGDNPCANINIHELLRRKKCLLSRRDSLSCRDSQLLSEIARFYNHIEMVEIKPVQEVHLLNLDLRKKYLKNEIDKDKFLRLALSRLKTREKTIDLNNLYEVVRNAITNILRENSIVSPVEQITDLLRFFNKESYLLSKRYDSNVFVRIEIEIRNYENIYNYRYLGETEYRTEKTHKVTVSAYCLTNSIKSFSEKADVIVEYPLKTKTEFKDFPFPRPL